jgi:hypothetical protein
MKLGLRLAGAAIAAAFLLAQSPRAFAQSDKKPNVEELIQRLEASEGHERDVVMEELDQIKDADVLVPPLLAALDGDDPQNARKLLDVLARFPAVQLTVPLVRLARRADPIPRGMEPFLVGELARKEVLKALTEVCASWKPPAKNSDDAGAEELTEAQKEERESGEARRSRGFLEWAGAMLGQTDSAGLSELLSMLRDHSACRQTAAKDGLIAVVSEEPGRHDSRIVKEVVAALGDQDTGVQWAATAILENIIGFDGTSLSKDMVEPLFLILKTHPDSGTRYEAFILLQRGPGDIPKMAAVIAANDPDRYISRDGERLLEDVTVASPNLKP